MAKTTYKLKMLRYEVWYKSPTGRDTKIAAFKMRFMAEKFMQTLTKYERETSYIVEAE